MAKTTTGVKKKKIYFSFGLFARNAGRRLRARTVLGRRRLEQERPRTQGVPAQGHVHGDARDPRVRDQFAGGQADERLPVSGVQEAQEDRADVRVRAAAENVQGALGHALDVKGRGPAVRRQIDQTALYL